MVIVQTAHPNSYRRKLIIGPYFKFDWDVGKFSKIRPYFSIEINTLNIEQPQVQFLMAL